MAQDTAIFGPVFALAAWTLAVLLRVAFVRLSAAWRREVQPSDFRLGESPSVPAPISLPNRNYMNLLELPVLFYVVCIVAYVTATAGALVIGLAWVYVALRVVHSLVHLAYNNVVHRLAAFAASNFVLVAIWVLVGVALHAKSAA